MANKDMTLMMRIQAEASKFVSGVNQADQRLAKLGNTSKRVNSEFAKMERTGVSAANKLALGFEKASSKIQNSIQGIAKAVVAYQAAKFVIADAAKAPMDYDRRLALMANTAYANRDSKGRIAGKRELDSAIVGAVRSGGGSREIAAETLDKLIGSGSMSKDSALKLLPTLQKYSSATGADSGALADIAIRGKQNLNLSDSQITEMLDKAIVSGQRGGFELRDMAKFLPQQMALMSLSGMRGMSGFERILTSNQLGVTAAGTKDEAGNNLVNLLAKINSVDTARDAKKQGIDLPGYLAKKRLGGVNSLDAFVELTDTIAGKDKRFTDLKNKSKNATGADKADAYAGMADILQGSAIGKIVQDRQALMQLIAEMNNRDLRANLDQGHRVAKGEGRRSFGTVSNTASYQTERVANEKAIAQQKAFDSGSGSVSRFMGLLADSAQKFPNFTAGVVASTVALTALAAAAGAAGLAGMLTRGKGAGLSNLPAGASGPGKLSKYGKFGAAGTLGLPGLAVTAAGLAGMGYGKAANKGINYLDSKFNTGIGNAIGRQVALALSVLPFFQIGRDARSALRNEFSAKKSDLSGNLQITLNDNRAPALSFKSNQPGMKVNMSNGPLMTGAQ